MLWSVLYCTLLLAGFYYSFFWTSFHVYVLLTLIYGLIYFGLSGPQRRWKRLRSLLIWDLIRTWYFPHRIHAGGDGWNHLDQPDGRRRAYVFCTGVEARGFSHHELDHIIMNLSLFAFHGKKNRLLATMSPLVTIPLFYMYLPYVTDILQWFGCVPKDWFDPEPHLLQNTSVTLSVWEIDNLVKRAAADKTNYTHVCIVPVLHCPSGPLYRPVANSSFHLRVTVRLDEEEGETGTRDPVIMRPPLWTRLRYFRIGGVSPFEPLWNLFPRRREIHTYLGTPIPITSDRIAADLDEAFNLLERTDAAIVSGKLLDDDETVSDDSVINL